jgi:predicted CopG family antitoxin
MSKTITIRNEVYDELKKIKKKEESFSELFERLSREKIPSVALSKLRGAVSFRDKDKMLSEIDAKRSEERI